MPPLPLTPRQAADLVGVSESTVRRWCDSGSLAVVKTTGGHRRIDRITLLDFARKRGLTLVDSSPISTSGRGGRLSAFSELADRLYHQLVTGDVELVRDFVVGLLERSGDAAKLCDLVVAPAMHRIGEQWSEGALRVFREHAATQIAEMALWAARAHVEPPAVDAPTSICAALSGDPYSLGPAMSGLVLQQAGFRAIVLGPESPADEVAAAAIDMGASVVAISVSTVPSVEQRVDELAVLGAAAARHEFRVIVGGSQLTAELRRQIDPDSFGDTMTHLASFGRRALQAVRPQ